MAGRLLNVVTALSLVLLFGATASWVAGERWRDVWVQLPWPGERGPDRGSYLMCRGGAVYVVRQRATGAADGAWTVEATGPARWSLHVGDGVTRTFAMDFVDRRRVMPWFDLYHTTGVQFGAPLRRGGAVSGRFAMCPADVWALGVPQWAIVSALAALPAARCARAILRRHQRTRAARGRCIACGYDLRVTPDRCPECGRVHVAAASS